VIVRYNSTSCSFKTFTKMSSRRRSNSDCGREDAEYDAAQEKRWQEEEYEESLHILGLSEEEVDAHFTENNRLVDEAIERYRANLETAVGYTLSPNRAILQEFYPDIQVPIPQWFSLLHEIRENRQHTLEPEFEAEVSTVLDDEESIWTDGEGEEEQEEEDEGPMCQPIFTAPIPLGECPICMDTLEMVNFTVTKCGHSFHATCLFRSVEDSSDCPLCRKRLTKKRERTNYDDIEWVEYEEEDDEATEYDEGGDEDDGEDEEEERGDNEPHWTEPPMNAEAIAQRKKKDEEFTTFAATFAGRTSHSIFIQAQDTYGEAHVCFTKSHAFRAAGDHWNAHQYQCRFAELIEKGHILMMLTEKRRRPDEDNNSIWQTNRKTHTYISPAASSKDLLVSILGPSKKHVESILELDLD
jgi:Zinc finger, C3HC4 type (RING finger)